MYKFIKEKNTQVILMLSLLLITSLIINISLYTKNNEQRQKIDTVLSNEKSLSELNTMYQNELSTYKINEINLLKQNEEYQESLLSLEKRNQLIKMDEHDVIINKYMSDGVISLFEAFVTAISTSDKDLYMSLLSNEIPDVFSDDLHIDKYHGYLLEPYNYYEGSKLNLKKIETSNPFRNTESEIDALRGESGWFYARIVVEDDIGNYSTISDIGIIFNQNTKSWEINDHH